MSEASAGGVGKGGGERRAGQEAEGRASQGQALLARPRRVDKAAPRSPEASLQHPATSAGPPGQEKPEQRSWVETRAARGSGGARARQGAGGRLQRHVAHGPAPGARRGGAGASLTPLAAAMRTMSWMASFM